MYAATLSTADVANRKVEKIESVSFTIALLSLAVSIWTAWESGLFQRHELFLASRLELHGLMQEADGLLLRNPRLLRAFRGSASFSLQDDWTAEDRDALSQMLLIYLNVFEAAFTVFRQIARLDSKERMVRDAWERTIAKFFDDCPAAADVWAVHRTTYYLEFQQFVDRIVRDNGKRQGQTSAPPTSYKP